MYIITHLLDRTVPEWYTLHYTERKEARLTIYTVTLNPSLDYYMELPRLKRGMVNRSEGEKIRVGGKGINVSAVIAELGGESTALGFVAGFTGEEIIKRLAACGIKNDFIRLHEGESRINVKILSDKDTEINCCGPEVCADDEKILLDMLCGVRAGDTVVFSGSVARGMSKTFYADAMKTLPDGVNTAVDTSGDVLYACLRSSPLLIKPNRYELGELFGVSIETKADALEYAAKLRQKGARNVLVTMDGDGAVLVAENGAAFSACAPSGTFMSAVGAGDSTVAGFLVEYFRSADAAKAFRLAVACGTATAYSNGLAGKKDIESVFARVAVRNEDISRVL